ncbi:MAG: hypothetical protein KDN05_11200 [Verrucomicrobiae bacterium]|nr:hypothetical protein [Verrucomicrobiae bacterium]
MNPQRRESFPDLTERDLRQIRRIIALLAEAEDLHTLGQEFVSEMERFLPADCMLWNLWTHGMGQLIDFVGNKGWTASELAPHVGAVNATIHHHPVIATGHADEYWRKPQRMSDFQSYGRFKSNPLYREVYRHIEANYQIGFHAANLEEGVLNLCWNLKHRDFKDAELQKLHLIGGRVGLLARQLEQKRILQSSWSVLKGRLAGVGFATAGCVPTLTATDGRILAELAAGKSRVEIAAGLMWRRDTLDRHIASLRDRLGFESMPQLLSAMGDLAACRLSGAPPRPTE